MSRNMPSPIDAFESWYGTLAFHDQIHLAMLVATAEGLGYGAAEGTLPVNDPTMPEGMIARLRRPYRLRLEVVGRLGLIRTIMEVCLAIPHSDSAEWARRRADMLTLMLMERSKGDAEAAEGFRAMLEKSPEDEDRWADIWLSWKELTENEGPLSDTSIREWYAEIFPQRWSEV